MLQFSFVFDRSLSLGINANDSEDSISEGFQEDILNGDVEASYISLRKGYERFCGDVPLRIESIVVYNDGAARPGIFYFPEYVDLSDVTSGPLKIKYKYETGGVVSSEVSLSPTSFTVRDRVSLPSTSTSVALTARDHTVAYAYSLIGFYDTSDASFVYTEDFVIDTGTLGLTINYKVAATISVSVVSYNPPLGEYYELSSASFSGGTDDYIEIDAAVHALPGPTMIPMIYEYVFGDVNNRQVLPERFVVYGGGHPIDKSGDVQIWFADRTKIVDSIYTSLVYSPLYVEGATSGFATSTSVDIYSTQAEAEGLEQTRHMFAACYRVIGEVEESGAFYPGDLELIYPESIVYTDSSDPTLRKHTVTFAHPEDSFSYIIVFAYGTTNTNSIVVAVSGISTAGTYDVVTGAVWGINQDLLPTKTVINYLDSYLQTDETVIAADGLFYHSRTADGFTEVVNETARTLQTRIVGPTFYPSAPVADRRRSNGYIVTSGATVSGLVEVESISYEASSGYTVYTLNVPSYTVHASTGATALLNVVIDAGASARDWLRITGEMNSRFNGEFRIYEIIEVDANRISLKVANSSITNSIWDTAESGAKAGIFTDSLLFSTDLVAEEGTTIQLSNIITVTVTDRPSTTTAYFTEATATFRILAGTSLGASYTSDELVLASSSILPGDSIEVGGISNRAVSWDSTTLTLRDEATVTDGIFTVYVPCRWSLIYPLDAHLGVDLISHTEMQRSVAAKGSLYLASGAKYDGTHVFKTGIPPMQPHLFISLVEGGGIPVTTNIQAISAGSGTTTLTVTDTSALKVGDTLLYRETDGSSKVTIDPRTLYTIQAISGSDVTLDKPITVAVAGELATYVELEYFTRLKIVETNGNVIVGPSTGAKDMRVRLTKAASVYIRGQALVPDVENIQIDNMVVEIFRKNNSLSVSSDQYGRYFKVGQVTLGDKGAPYVFTFIDTNPGVFSINDLDPIPDPSGGIGERRCRVVQAEHVTSINNQLAYSNLTGENKLRIGLYGESAVEASFLDKTFTVTTSAGDTEFKVVNELKAVDDITGSEGISFTVAYTTAVAIAKGDWIYIGGSGGSSVDRSTTFMGWWLVDAVVGGGSPTVTCLWEDAPATADITAADKYNLSMYYNLDGDVPLSNAIADYSLGQTMSLSTKIVDMFPFHLASAINQVLSTQGVYARAGFDFERGYLELFGDTLVELEIPTGITATTWFGNGTRLDLSSTAQTVEASRTLFSSRTVLSIPGYPEIFQDVETTTAVQTSTMLDVNPDDGEELTCAIPFFATSAFGAAQQSNVLVIFKAHSIYVVDPAAMYAGQSDFFKKLATRGLGCEAPGSVTNSKDGVFFASRSGIYMLDKTFEIRFSGDKLKNLWKDVAVDSTSLSRYAASNYVKDRKYYLSVPGLGSLRYTDQVFVLKYGDDPAEPQIAWTRYDNIYASCYANRNNRTFFSTDLGYVAEILDTNTYEDFHDAGSPIEMEIVFRAMDFGMPNVRKVLKFITMYFASTFDTEIGDVDMYLARDMSKDYVFLDTCIVKGTDALELNNIGDPIRDKVSRIAFSPDRAHMTWGQVKLVVSRLKSDFKVTKVVYRVAALRTRGESQSAQTKS